MTAYKLWTIPWAIWIVLSLAVVNGFEMNCCNYTESEYNISAEKRLTKHLLDSYMWAGRDGRPVKDNSRSTLVDMMLGLINIELDESEKVLTTSMWAKMQWKDEYMTWDPSLYDGLELARIESFNIWTPDIMLYNTLESYIVCDDEQMEKIRTKMEKTRAREYIQRWLNNGAEPESKVRNSLVMAHPDGTLVWVLHQIFKSSCSVNVTDFPFDTQVCHMWFGSWTHQSHEIDMNFLHPVGIDLGTFQTDYRDSCEWDIIKTIAQRITPSNISVLTYEIHMQRKMVFSSYILTLPCVFLATLTLVVFCLPPERPDRTGLAMNIFSSFLVLLLILVEAAPSSASSVPKLGIYYCFNMVIIMLSIFLSSLVVNIHRTDVNSRRVPAWARLVFMKGVARVLFPQNWRSAQQSRRSSMLQAFGDHMYLHNGVETKKKLKEKESLLYDETKHNELNSKRQDSILTQIKNGGGGDSGGSDGPDVTFVKDMRRDLKQIETYMSRRVKEDNRKKFIVREWRDLAKILDRLFFIVYLVAIVLSLIFLFPTPRIH